MATRKKAKKKVSTKRNANAYVPTARSRAMVREMVELDIPSTTIARFITNPKTGRAITQKTLVVNFKAELGDQKVGRQAFKPDDRQREQVLAMKGFGMAQDEIASIITNPRTNAGISKNTLEKNFRAELDQGTALMKFKVLGRIFQTACSPDHPGATTAGIFLCKTQYGFSEKHVLEITEGTGVLIAPPEIGIDVWIDGVEVKNAERRSPVVED